MGHQENLTALLLLQLFVVFLVDGEKHSFF